MMDEEEVLATGTWCLTCEFLEDDEDSAGKTCVSCGCMHEFHRKVKVVAV